MPLSFPLSLLLIYTRVRTPDLGAQYASIKGCFLNHIQEPRFINARYTWASQITSFPFCIFNLPFVLRHRPIFLSWWLDSLGNLVWSKFPRSGRRSPTDLLPGPGQSKKLGRLEVHGYVCVGFTALGCT